MLNVQNVGSSGLSSKPHGVRKPLMKINCPLQTSLLYTATFILPIEIVFRGTIAMFFEKSSILMPQTFQYYE